MRFIPVTKTCEYYKNRETGEYSPIKEKIYIDPEKIVSYKICGPHRDYDIDEMLLKTSDLELLMVNGETIIISDIKDLEEKKHDSEIIKEIYANWHAQQYKEQEKRILEYL